MVRMVNINSMNDYDYPAGADTSDAPWNEKEYSPKEVEVTVSVTLSKTVKVLVDGYEIEEKDGRVSYDLSGAVEEQLVLPQNLARFTETMFEEDLDLKAAGMPKYLKDAVSDCKDWYVDDMEVILE